MVMNRVTFWGFAALGCVLVAPLTFAQDAEEGASVDQEHAGHTHAAIDQNPDPVVAESPKENALLSGEPVKSKPIDMAFMYKGIGKFVTPEDQIKVKELLTSAETLGPDGPQLILEDIDRRVPNGDGFQFDGIMWSNSDNEFAAIDVYATPGNVPEDWSGLIAPPYEFPVNATYLVGSTKGMDWFGTAASLGVRVDIHPPTGDRLIKGYTTMYREMAEISRDPGSFQRRIDPAHTGIVVTSDESSGNEVRLRSTRWGSVDQSDNYLLIESGTHGLDGDPLTEWVYLHWWISHAGAEKMRVVHLSQWAIEPEKQKLPESPQDLFLFYDLFPVVRHSGVFVMKGEFAKEHMQWEGP